MYCVSNQRKREKKRNKWIRQQIDKKLKNKHDKKHYKTHKRITTQKASKLHPYICNKNRTKKPKPSDYFRITVDISLINNENEEIRLKNANYKLMKCQLTTATINIYNVNQKISYSSYCFIPCYRYDNVPDNGFKANYQSMYELRNDIYIPLFFNKMGVICDRINIFDENVWIDIDKTAPLIDIANACWKKRNPLNDKMNTDWFLYAIDYKENKKIDITLQTYIRIKNKSDLTKFIKWRPFKKKIYQQLKVYDTVQHHKLTQNSVKTDGIHTYFNIPLLLSQQPISMKSYFSNNTLYKRFINEIIYIEPCKNKQLEKEEIMNFDGYWFCDECFCINYNKSDVIHQCKDCDKIYPVRQKVYYESESFKVSDDIIKLITGYDDIKKNECITNRKFIDVFLRKYNELRDKYRDKMELSKPGIVYHWTYSKWFDSIKEIGLIVPNDNNSAIHKTDIGFYGRGIYTSPSLTYAKCYGDCDKVFVCLCLAGKQFAAQYPRDLGIGLKMGFDSHHSSDRGQMEWVFFKTNQLLLIYLIDYKKVNKKFKSHLNEIVKYIVDKKK